MLQNNGVVRKAPVVRNAYWAREPKDQHSSSARTVDEERRYRVCNVKWDRTYVQTLFLSYALRLENVPTNIGDLTKCCFVSLFFFLTLGGGRGRTKKVASRF